MKRFLKEYFSFTKSERNGVLVLIIIIVLLIATQQSLDFFAHKNDIDFSEFEKEIDDFEASLKTIKENKNQYKNNYQKNKPVNIDTVDFFYFDPNKITENDWEKLGLPDKLIKTIMNYKNKGGKFFEKKDLQKIYGMPETLYDTLKHYIIIESPKKTNNYQTHRKQTKTEKTNYNNLQYNNDIIIEINTAGQEDLIKIYGIGEVFAYRIISYRNLLGGYVNTEQLKEVYGITDDIYKNIKSHFVIDTSKIKKINLNKTGYKELIRHPYIDNKTTKAILKYRDKVNIIYNIDELIKNNIVEKNVFSDIKHYITVKY